MENNTKEKQLYLTENGMKSCNELEQNNMLPLLVLNSNIYLRKVCELVNTSLKEFADEANLTLKRRVINDSNAGLHKTVFFVSQENFVDLVQFFNQQKLEEQIGNLIAQIKNASFILETGKSELVKQEIFQKIVKQNTSETPENTVENQNAEEIVITIKKRNSNTAKKQQKKPIKSAKNSQKKPILKQSKSQKPYQKWGIQMPPLPDNATEEQIRQRKNEYRRELRLRKKQAEEQYVASLSEEERQQYLAEKKQKSSEEYSKKKEKEEQRLALMSEEELKAERERKNTYRRNCYANTKKREEEKLLNMSEEEKQSYLAEKSKKRKEQAEKRLEGKTVEEVEELKKIKSQKALESYHKRMENMSEEEYDNYLKHRREKARERKQKKELEKTA